MAGRVSLESFKIRLNIKKELDVELLEDTYKGMGTLCTFNCLTHGNFKKTPNDFLRSKGCTECSLEKKIKFITVPHIRLQQLLNYEESTGKFIWRSTGKVSGYKGKRGFVNICLEGGRYKAHRLVLFYQTGIQCKKEIVHIDGDRSNNRWENLKVKDSSVFNVRKSLGVFKSRGVWRAKLVVNGVSYVSKPFEKKSEALEARIGLEINFIS